MPRASLRRLGGETAPSVRNAHLAWPRRSGLLLSVDDGEGHEGHGEASPLPGYSPESLDDCWFSLLPFVRAPFALPASPLAIEQLAAHLPGAARFALETALLDLLAQRSSSSGGAWHALLGREHPQPVEVSGLLDLTKETDFSRRRVWKLKIGALPLPEELARLRALRLAAGPGVALRLDANGAYRLDEAPAILAALAEVEPELIEEPVAGEALARLGRCAIPWAADESLRSHADALLGCEACDAVVLKPAVLGFLGALRLAERATQAGKGVIVTHLFDGPVALSAAWQLARCLPAPPLPCGLDEHDALAALAP